MRIKKGRIEQIIYKFLLIFIIVVDVTILIFLYLSLFSKTGTVKASELIDCINCNTCESDGFPISSNGGNACGNCHARGDACSLDECCADFGECCGSSCSCTPDSCSVSCDHPNASGYRRHAEIQNDFVRDCSDPCNPNEYYCSCTNYTNSAPSCSISLPLTITYDAQSYILGSITNHQSSYHQATLHISDNDESDKHKIVSVNISSNCLQVKNLNNSSLVNSIINPNNRSYKFKIRPLGALDGVTPNLTNDNKCHVTLTIHIKDLVGDSGDSSDYTSCSASTTVIYPPPRLTQIKIIDNNPQSFYGNNDYNDGKYHNTKQDNQFILIGSTTEDPYTATINLINAGTATQHLAPIENRFSNYSYKMSDHNYFTIQTTITDLNGNNTLKDSVFNIDLYKNTGVHMMLPLVLDADALYGIDNDGHVHNVSNNANWQACLTQNYNVCVLRDNKQYLDANTIQLTWHVYIKKNTPLQGARYWLYIKNVRDVEGVPLYKNQTNTILHNAIVSLLDSNINVLDKDNNKWSTSNGGNEFLYLDSQPPIIQSANITQSGTDKVKLTVVVKDNNHVDSGFTPSLPNVPIARTYVFAENSRSGKAPGVSNRFLLASDASNKPIEGQDFGNGSNIYAWHCNQDSATQRTCSLNIGGLRGGDHIIYGFCVFDKAGNVNCYDSDQASPLPPLTIGDPWIKTSLGHVYSKGGFGNLPNYSVIQNVSEDPVDFHNLVNPFVATQYASLSTFFVGALETQSNYIRWGYNNNWQVSGFYNLDINFNHSNWSTFLEKVLFDKCDILNNCHVFAVNNKDGLLSALHNTNYAYKIIQVNQNISLDTDLNGDSIVKFVNNNVIILKNNKQLVLYNLEKQHGLSSLTDSLLVIAEDSARVIIDDKPNSGYDNLTDIIQAGFVILDNSRFISLQGVTSNNRDAYKDSNGKFDRSIIHGFLYSQTTPILERDLVLADNKKYPADWFIYDYSIISNLQELLGRRKMQVYNCANIDAPACKQ